MLIQRSAGFLRLPTWRPDAGDSVARTASPPLYRGTGRTAGSVSLCVSRPSEHDRLRTEARAQRYHIADKRNENLLLHDPLLGCGMLSDQAGSLSRSLLDESGRRMLQQIPERLALDSPSAGCGRNSFTPGSHLTGALAPFLAGMIHIHNYSKGAGKKLCELDHGVPDIAIAQELDAIGTSVSGASAGRPSAFLGPRCDAHDRLDPHHHAQPAADKKGAKTGFARSWLRAGSLRDAG